MSDAYGSDGEYITQELARLVEATEALVKVARVMAIAQLLNASAVVVGLTERDRAALQPVIDKMNKAMGDWE
jgi:hypothetical protein